jgi:hypothetical protein
MRPVVSSSVAAIAYDEQAQEVYVRFIGGRTYAYGGVPRAIWREFQSAPSKGAFVNRVLKPVCPCRRV